MFREKKEEEEKNNLWKINVINILRVAYKVNLNCVSRGAI